jgi:hypothetical protein
VVDNILEEHAASNFIFLKMEAVHFSETLAISTKASSYLLCENSAALATKQNGEAA